MKSREEKIRNVCWNLIEMDLNDKVLPIKNKKALKNTFNGKTICLMIIGEQCWGRFTSISELEDKNGFLFIATYKPNNTFSLYKIRLEDALNCDWSKYKNCDIHLNEEDFDNNSNILRIGDNSKKEYMKMKKIYEITSF